MIILLTALEGAGLFSRIKIHGADAVKNEHIFT